MSAPSFPLCYISIAVVVILKVAVKFVDPYNRSTLIYSIIVTLPKIGYKIKIKETLKSKIISDLIHILLVTLYFILSTLDHIYFMYFKFNLYVFVYFLCVYLYSYV